MLSANFFQTPEQPGPNWSRGAANSRVYLGVLVLFCTAGCNFLNRSPATAPAGLENPLFLPPVDRELLWNQTVDAIDDYFRIEREDRIRLIGGVLTEGRIDTFPTTGSTLLEPWRRDSTHGYEKLHATLQSIRRRATVRLIPVEGGTLLDVVVQKELEDLDKPEHATAGGATLRHDGTIVRQQGPPGRYSVTLGWIPIGRDFSLEQRILADVSGRVGAHSHGANATSTFPFLENLFAPPPTEPAIGPELKPPLLEPSRTPNFEPLPPPIRRSQER